MSEEGKKVKPSFNISLGLGYGYGSMIAIAISWSLNKSVFWAVVQGWFSWFYIIYYWIFL